MFHRSLPENVFLWSVWAWNIFVDFGDLSFVWHLFIIILVFLGVGWIDRKLVFNTQSTMIVIPGHNNRTGWLDIKHQLTYQGIVGAWKTEKAWLLHSVIISVFMKHKILSIETILSAYTHTHAHTHTHTHTHMSVLTIQSSVYTA